MTEEINNHEQAKHRRGLWIGLAIGLVSLVGLIALGGCSKNSANSGNTPPSPGTVVKNSIGMEFVYVPAGSFQMGSKQVSWEEPIHQVTIANGFYLGRYEVTESQWQKVMGKDHPLFRNYGENFPVESVKWADAQEFIKKLNAANDGYTYRMPSEAEWEYACRAGTTGDKVGDVSSMSWTSENSNDQLHPVGQKKPNAWGLYDMLGNAAEWVMDNYHENYNGAPTDGSAWTSGGDSIRRVDRSGSMSEKADDLYPARRWGDDAINGLGFRVVAVPQSK